MTRADDAMVDLLSIRKRLFKPWFAIVSTLGGQIFETKRSEKILPTYANGKAWWNSPRPSTDLEMFEVIAGQRFWDLMK